MPDVEEAWASVPPAIDRYADVHAAPIALGDIERREKALAAVRDAMLAAYDAGALAERRYGRWRRPYMMDEKRARIQALGEPR